eukprot:TRINITY_DN1182_c0_g1_i2.p1 TRINITY_DN1182_c0_g1~~TRINITY_DN1182_c0_g1_i2.p1  ORF type:complete len:428 (+),score=83.02 TRINITY_DN1182_c0_g1_i2:98-1381(+)
MGERNPQGKHAQPRISFSQEFSLPSLSSNFARFSQLMTSNFPLSLHPLPPSDKNDRPLIPGLPDDLALDVLLHVPRWQVPQLRCVCRRWRDLVGSEAFYSARVVTGLAEAWLYASVSDWQGSNCWFSFDPSTSAWKRLPQIPGSEHRNILTLQLAALSGKLLVSGMVERENPVGGANSVFLYDPRTNSWRRGAAINTGRWFCMSGIVEGKLYVAGGIGTCNNLALVDTIEMYDPEHDTWQQVHTGTKAELMTLPGYQAVLDGRLYAKNIGWGPGLGISYDPATGLVQELSSVMVQGWQGPTTALEGRLYIVDFGDDHKLKVWEDSSSSGGISSCVGGQWRAIRGGTVQLAANGHKPWAVQLVALNGWICLVLPDLSLRMVDLRPMRTNPNAQLSVVVVEGPRPGDGTGEGVELGTTAAVLGCQVLAA